MKKRLFPSLSYLILGICFLLSSCAMTPPDSTMNWCYGTLALHPPAGLQLCRSFETYRPSTVKELRARIGSEALAEYNAPEGKYSFWGYRQTHSDGQFYEASIGCLSKNGKIIAVASLYPGWLGYGVTAGDKYLYDQARQPQGFQKAINIAFHKQEKHRAAHFGKRVVFSPNGKGSVLLGPGDHLHGWQGDEPIVSWAQNVSSVAQRPAFDITPVLNVLANPQTWQVPAANDSLQQQRTAERNRIINQSIIDTQRRKAEIEAENMHNLLLKRARESGKFKCY